MAKTPITKEYLVKIAMKIIDEEGIDALSIRRVAKDADIAIGSVYNYFESKSQLTFEVVRLLWDSVFIADLEDIVETQSYLVFIEEAYHRIHRHAKTYHTIFVGHFRSLSAEQRKESHKVHIEQISKFAIIFQRVLEKDPQINSDVWTTTFTQKEYNEFVIRNLLEYLRNDSNDITFLKTIVELTLYR